MKPWHHPNLTDFIAILFIGIAVLGILFEVDRDFMTPLGLIAGYYFGKKASTLPPSTGDQ